MNFEFLSYWALVAFSLFNTIVLFWLGFTVWLNAEKRGRKIRQGGIWVATAGLLLGGVFFATHTAMLDFTLDALVTGVRSWWYFFFAPIVLLPHAWYLLMLWYAGFWDDADTPLRRRHQWTLCITTILALALLSLLFVANPFLIVERSARGIVFTGARLFPIVALLYPFYLISCTAFSLDALHRPARSARMMGDLSRHHARPWLLAASSLQFLVSLLVGSAFLWLWLLLNPREPGRLLNDGARWIDQFDLLLSFLIAVTIVLVGKAIVSYEIFTGKALPRRGFLRQWRGVVTVAALSSAVLAWCLSTNLRPTYALLLVVIVATVIIALLSWHFFNEREEMMRKLRPFAASQHFYERVLGSSEARAANQTLDMMAGRAEALTEFVAICDMLETSGACLLPLGTLAPLVDRALCHPDEAPAPLLPQTLASHNFSPQEMVIALPPAGHETSTGEEQSWHATWAIPLWSGKSQVGILLLGDKKRGALYNEEEIAFAQASCQRLLDTLAGATLAARLMELQRHHRGEAQLSDGQSTLRLRRALHDEILPRLHAALLMMHGDDAARREAQTQLSDAHREISGLLHAMPSALPSSLTKRGLFGALRHVVEEDFSECFDAVEWRITSKAELSASGFSDLVTETLFHAAREAIRNASRHARGARETARLQLVITAHATDQFWELAVEDDGIGAASEYSRCVRDGHGLALHSTMLAVIGGALAVETVQPHGTRVRLNLQRESSFKSSSDDVAQTTEENLPPCATEIVRDDGGYIKT
jgi:two-component sensor histidine kinase